MLCDPQGFCLAVFLHRNLFKTQNIIGIHDGHRKDLRQSFLASGFAGKTESIKINLYTISLHIFCP